MSDKQETYNYEPFADTEDYKKVNGDIIASWVQLMVDKGMGKIDQILDVATGAGTMVQLFFTYLPSTWKKAVVMCLDQSSDALKVAQSKLDDHIDKLKFINSSIEDLDLPSGSVDIAVWGNGIHYLTETAQIDCLKNIKKVLKPNGWLFFNTAFYEEARPADTIPFYRTQVKNAVLMLKEKGIKREREEKKAEAAKFHPRSYYEDLVSQAGFKLVNAQEFAAHLTQEAWEHISGFQQYAAGALHGYPTDDASTAMKSAVAPSILIHGEKDKDGKLFVIRNWLAVSARA